MRKDQRMGRKPQGQRRFGRGRKRGPSTKSTLECPRRAECSRKKEEEEEAVDVRVDDHSDNPHRGRPLKEKDATDEKQMIQGG